MKNVFKILGVIALVAVIGFGVVSCGGDSGGGGGGNTGGGDSGGGNKDFAGTFTIELIVGGQTSTSTEPIAISPRIKLFLRYDGNEWLVPSVQWKKDGNNFGDLSFLGEDFWPSEPGTYTAVVSSSGYKSKTSSNAVTLTALPKTVTGSATPYIPTGETIKEVNFSIAVYQNVAPSGTIIRTGSYSVDFTTNLPAPNNSFTLTTSNGTASKTIKNISGGNVTFTATTTTGGLEVPYSSSGVPYSNGSISLFLETGE